MASTTFASSSSSSSSGQAGVTQHAPAISSPLASPRNSLTLVAVAPGSPATGRRTTTESPPAVLAREIDEATHVRYSPRTSARASPLLAPIAESDQEVPLASSSSDDFLHGSGGGRRPRSNSARHSAIAALAAVSSPPSALSPPPAGHTPPGQSPGGRDVVVSPGLLASSITGSATAAGATASPAVDNLRIQHLTNRTARRATLNEQSRPDPASLQHP